MKTEKEIKEKIEQCKSSILENIFYPENLNLLRGANAALEWVLEEAENAIGD